MGMTVEEIVAERMARIHAEETAEQKAARERREKSLKAVIEADVMVEKAKTMRLERLRVAHAAGVSQSELGRALGLDRTTIYRWLESSGDDK